MGWPATADRRHRGWRSRAATRRARARTPRARRRARSSARSADASATGARACAARPPNMWEPRANYPSCAGVHRPTTSVGHLLRVHLEGNGKCGVTFLPYEFRWRSTRRLHEHDLDRVPRSCVRAARRRHDCRRRVVVVAAGGGAFVVSSPLSTVTTAVGGGRRGDGGGWDGDTYTFYLNIEVKMCMVV